MSSILKALKKLDDDNSTRKPDDLKIDAEILRIDSSPRTSSAVIISLALFLLAGGSGATYLYMKREKVSEPAVTTQLTTPISSVENNSKTAHPSPAIKTEQLPKAIIVVPAKKQEKVSKKIIKRQKSPSKIKTAKILHPIKTVEPVTESKTISRPPSSVLDTTIPTIRVNGIAFQDNSADTMAIINGNPVAVGATVEGAVVEKILKDKVIFQINGQKFEIKQGQSNR